MTIRDRLSLTLFGDTLASWWRISLVVFLALCWAWPFAYFVDAVINRAPPVTYIEAYAPHPAVPAGGEVEVRFDVDRHRICPVIKVARAIVDATGLEHVVLGYTQAPLTRPGREVYDRIITVPETVPPGEAFYRIRIEYGCNLLNYWGWPIVLESPHVPLTILPRPDKLQDALPVKPQGLDDERDG